MFFSGRFWVFPDSLKEMYRVGVSPRFDVIVQFIPKSGNPRRFRIVNARTSKAPERASQKDSDPSPVFRNVESDGNLQRIGREIAVTDIPCADIKALPPQQSLVNQAALEEFVVSSIKANEAEHYMLSLNGHGSGAVGHSLVEDGFSPGTLRIPDLASVLEAVRERTGRRLDVLAMDSCLMSMAEVC